LAENDTRQTKAIAENISDDALSSKTIVDYNGTNIDVTNIDGLNETKA
jgi:hypothetical protein